MTLSSLRQVDDLLRKREIKKAEVLIAKFLRSDLSSIDRAEWLISRARARLLGARFDDALDDLVQAKNLVSEVENDPAFLELLGDVHFARFELASVGFTDRHDTENALNAYERILNRFPAYANIGWVKYQKARILLTENRVSEAASCLHEALNSTSQVQSLTAYCYERLGFIAFYETRDLPGALAFLDQAVAHYPPDEMRAWLTQVLTLRARILREMNNFDMALEAASLAIQNATASGSDGKLGLADALLTAGEIACQIEGREREVILYLQQFLQSTRKPLGIDVTYSRVYEMLGDAYMKTGSPQTAVSAYLNALQFNPYHPWEQTIYYRMSRCYYQLRDYNKAIQTIEQMIASAQVDGGSVSDYRVYHVLGNCFYALGQYTRALEAYQVALEIAPPNAQNVETIRQYYQYAHSLSHPV
jgi:tetratricopeptide (TPR) repeat protein